MTTPALSKSLFKLGLECPLRIKHSLTKPALPRRSGGDEYMRMLAEGGARRGQAVPIICLNRNWHLLFGFWFSAPKVRPDPVG